MTTLFLCKDVVIADSNHVRGRELHEESFHSLSKIHPVAPFKLTYETTEDDRRVSGGAFMLDMDDTIHGWMCTGSNPAAEAFVRAIRRKADGDEVSLDPKTLLAMYALADVQRLVTVENEFTVILIGEKKDYSYSFSFGVQRWSEVERDDPTAYGSGAEIIGKEYFRCQDPIRAMFTTMTLDENTSGIIDVWHLPTVTEPSLYRTAIYNERLTLGEIFELLKQPLDVPIVPDLVCLAEAKKMAVGIAVEFLEKRAGATPKEAVKKKAAKKSTAKKSTSSRVRTKA